MSAPSPVLLEDLLSLAIQLADQAAEIIREGAKRELKVTTKSSPTDLVSEVDAAAEKLIVDGILAARPHDGILGEEGSDIAGSNEVLWIIDPIDGTINYLYGFPSYSVSIAVQVAGETVVGVVHDPLRNEVFSATKGNGANCNGTRMQVRGAAELSQALISTGFSYRSEQRKLQAEVLLGLITEVRDIRRAGSAALDLCWVAKGIVDGYYERGLNPWDLAAGVLIVEESGGATGGLGTAPASPALTIAASPSVFEPLKQLLTQLTADQPE
jgi:myo-inositol-1(or 4)-monophosphatase